MEGKVKIWMVLLISIIVILIGVVLVCLCVFSSAEKKDKISEYETQIADLENKVEELQNTIDSLNSVRVENTIDNNVVNNTSDSTNSSTKTNTTTTSKTKKEFSDSEVKSVLQDYLNIKGGQSCSCEMILINMGYDDLSDRIINQDEDGIIETDIEYAEYKEKMLNCMTEDLFLENEFYIGENDDGMVAFYEGGGAMWTYTVKSVENISDLKYKATVLAELDDDETEPEEKEIEFFVENEDGKVVISSIDMEI